MNSRLALVLICLGALFLTVGCASISDRGSEGTQVDELLAYFHHIDLLPVDGQRKEHLEAMRLYELDRSDDVARLRLAIILMVPGVPWHDDSRAFQLLGEVDTADGVKSSPRRDLAALLKKMVASRRDDLRKCEQKADVLRDDRRKLEQKLELAREECKRSELLKQKLDELRDIDRNLRRKKPTGQTKQ